MRFSIIVPIYNTEKYLDKYDEYLMSETRYAQLKNINPTEAEKLLAKNKEEAQRRYKSYQRYLSMNFAE